MQRNVNFKIDEELYKRFKIICVHMNLSLPKQNIALIEAFVNVQEEKMKILSEMKERK